MASFLIPSPDRYMCKDVNRGMDAHFFWRLSYGGFFCDGDGTR